ncbi:glycosyltransferase [Salisediminibacterium halotolerans]|uniref:Glycosyltransferase involved in cell wall bisynthesis n=1 Tax=Salisediminibacterium halotolerans TaxID=517425 RepID=A0A1H9VY39_9BACI|nr:glycosyltransferase [Salisediminibacterium haloalkalitolerans]SES26414.1 Glycosyltransferase involved in cell wall bisynthesis [Salisediminibacterium haloalkalitolerans]
MNSPTRVLHVVAAMNRSGEAKFLMNLYRAMNRAEIQFDFLTAFPGDYDDEIRNTGGKVYEIPFLTKSGRLRNEKLLASFLAANTYQIVHVHTGYSAGSILAQAKENGVPVRIAHSHLSEGREDFLEKTINIFAAKRIRLSATHRFACSLEAGKRLFGKNTFFIQVNYAVDPERFRFRTVSRKAARLAWGWREEHFVIGYIGGMSQADHLFWLLARFEQLVSAMPKARLVMIGEGPMKSRLKEEAEKKGLENYVHFDAQTDECSAVLNGMDVLTRPGSSRMFPGVLIEAQSSGLPCLVADDVSRETDMESGLMQFLPLKRPQKWEEELVRLSRLKMQRRSETRSVKQKGYDMNSTAREMESFYRSRTRETVYEEEKHGPTHA